MANPNNLHHIKHHIKTPPFSLHNERWNEIEKRGEEKRRAETELS